MELRPKAFCVTCNQKVDYRLESSMRDVTVRDVSFSFLETRAKCKICNTPVYVPQINDMNVRERHNNYYKKLYEMEAQNTNDCIGAS